MITRRRPDTLPDKRPALDAMGRCRTEMIRVNATVQIGGDLYRAAAAVTAAIDAMAGLLTGDETYYHAGGSSPGADERKWRDGGW